MSHNLIKISSLLLAAWLIAGCGTNINQGKAGSSSDNESTVGGFNNQSAPTGCDPANPFDGGNGTASTPYLIATTCSLLNLGYRNDLWGARFRLVSDLDMTGISLTRTVEFTGVFDGQNHRIMNLTMKGPHGLFETSSGTITNLIVQGFSLDCQAGSRNGGIVGTNYVGGVVSNSSAVGSMTRCTQYSGGLVGLNQGSITHSFANVSISGYASIGGLTGYNSGTIQTSYALGNVTATNSGAAAGNGGIDAGVGGVAGTNIGTITNSYSRAIVSGLDDVGGLVGFNNSIVTNSFAAGAIGGTGINLGGLVGRNNGGSVTNSYFDYQVAGTTSGAGTSQTTSQMQNVATFTGWNFTTIWNAPAASYPTLR